MRRGVLLAVGLGLAATLLAPTSAWAQRRGDWYRDVRPYLGRRSGETVREARLWEDVVQLRGAVRRLDRRGDLTSRQADRFYDRIDRVARFLQDDRHLTDKEFDRRRDDLRDIANDLHRSYRDRRVSSRDDDRSSRRSDDRYSRRDSSYCEVCEGTCRHR